MRASDATRWVLQSSDLGGSPGQEEVVSDSQKSGPEPRSFGYAKTIALRSGLHGSATCASAFTYFSNTEVAGSPGARSWKR